MSCTGNPQLDLNRKICFGEVQYYFNLVFHTENYPLAMVSIFSQPDEALLLLSHQAVCLCKYNSINSLQTVPVKCIKSLVAMVPDFYFTGEGEIVSNGDYFFLVEERSLDVINYFGFQSTDDEDDNVDTPS